MRELNGANRAYLGGTGSRARGYEGAACRSAVGFVLLDVLAISFGYAGVEGGPIGNPWSHGLFMSVVWSVALGLLTTRVYRDYRAGVVVGLLVFSHWVLDFISHPIPFSSFSWRSWQWNYGHPLPSDLPLLFGGSPKVGLGLYNSISAFEATVLEFGMFVVGAAVYAGFLVNRRRQSSTAISQSPEATR